MVRAWSGVSAISMPSLRPSDASSEVADPGVVRRRDGDRAGPRPATGPPPADHAQLEREQLVEGEPAEGRVARLECRREVGRLERLADGRELARGADVVRQVLRVVRPGRVQRLAHGAPEAVGRDPGGQPVDGHDPADMEQVRRIGRLEVGRLEHHARPGDA